MNTSDEKLENKECEMIAHLDFRIRHHFSACVSFVCGEGLIFVILYFAEGNDVRVSSEWIREDGNWGEEEFMLGCTWNRLEKMGTAWDVRNNVEMSSEQVRNDDVCSWI